MTKEELERFNMGNKLQMRIDYLKKRVENAQTLLTKALDNNFASACISLKSRNGSYDDSIMLDNEHITNIIIRAIDVMNNDIKNLENEFKNL